MSPHVASRCGWQTRLPEKWPRSVPVDVTHTVPDKSEYRRLFRSLRLPGTCAPTGMFRGRGQRQIHVTRSGPSLSTQGDPDQQRLASRCGSRGFQRFRSPRETSARFIFVVSGLPFRDYLDGLCTGKRSTQLVYFLRCWARWCLPYICRISPTPVSVPFAQSVLL